jgi:hypothetical protein
MTTYDPTWDWRVEAAHEILIAAADDWALQTIKDPVCDDVLRVVVHILGIRWSRWDFPSDRRESIRSLSQWLQSVTGLDAECARLLPKSQQMYARDVAEALREIVSAAADGWHEGNPEEPPTSAILNAIIGILFENQMVRHPPSEKPFTSTVDWLASKPWERRGRAT